GKGELFRAWGSTEVKEARRLVDVCLEAGVNLFDTADAYSSGRSEEILGEAVQGRRQDLLIATKAFFRMGTHPNHGGTSRYHLVAACEASLKRLRTDYIDIFQNARLRCHAAGGRDSARSRRFGQRRKGTVCGRLQFLRLAPDEVSRRERPVRLVALCFAPGLLFTGRPRI